MGFISNRLTAAFLLFTSLYAISHAQIVLIQAPVSTADLPGGDVQINCTISLTSSQVLTWTFNGAGSSIDQTIVIISSSGPSWESWAENQFTLNMDTNLVIRDFAYTRAGKYTCQIVQTSPTTEQQSYPVEVMALTELTMDSVDVLDGQDTSVTCAVNITGEYTPRIRMFRENTNTPLETYTISEPIVPDGEFRLLQYGYNFTTAVTDNNIEFICDLMFTAYGADNPTFIDVAYHNLTVYHGVMGIEITPNSDNGIPTVEVGSYINCSATGEPEPEFFWTDLAENTTSINGSSLEVTHDMIGRNEYMCTAYNFVNETLNEINKTVIFTAVHTNGSNMVLPSLAFSFLMSLFLTIIS